MRALGSATWIAVAVASMLCPAVAKGQEEGGGGPPPTAVRVDTVQREMLQERRRVTGELRAVKRSRIATIEPGRVVSRPAEEGRRVRAGDLLAVLDSRRLTLAERRLKARAKVADATIEARQSVLEQLQRDFEMLSELDAMRASNPKEIADAEFEVRTAAANLEAARQDLAVIQAETNLVLTRLEDMNVRAPFDGIVIEVLTEKGQWVAEGDPIVEILSIDACEAWLDVPQRFAPAILGRNAQVQVTIDPLDRTMPPAVPVAVPNVNTTARSFKIFVRLVNEGGLLAPGMSVTGWVPTGVRETYLTIPRNAVMRNDAGPYVFVARSMGPGPAKATPVPVSIAFQAGERVAVRPGGLAEGDLVIVEGNERLFPMMPVSFTAPAAQARGAGDPPADGAR